MIRVVLIALLVLMQLPAQAQTATHLSTTNTMTAALIRKSRG